MKLPIFVLPNTKNQPDIQMLDADGRSLTATEFSNIIGGIKSLRFMVGDASIFSRMPQITSQETKEWGRLFCIAFPSGIDSSKRITSGAVILRETDIDDLSSDPKLGQIAGEAGIDEHRRNLVAPTIEQLKRGEAQHVKKKP